MNKLSYISEVLSFMQLDEDWDGYNGYPPSLNSLLNTIQFITLLDGIVVEKISDIFPTPNGTLVVDWDSPEEMLGLEIGNTTFSYYVKRKSQDTLYFNEILISKDEIDKINSFVKNLKFDNGES